MSLPHRTSTPQPTSTAPVAPPASDATSPTSTDPPEAPSTTQAPRTRTSTAWLTLCVGALAFLILIIFMLQNTGSIEIHFLGLHGTLPLALALLIAAVGSTIITLAVGTARIAQLRRFSRRTH